MDHCPIECRRELFPSHHCQPLARRKAVLAEEILDAAEEARLVPDCADEAPRHCIDPHLGLSVEGRLGDEAAELRHQRQRLRADLGEAVLAVMDVGDEGEAQGFAHDGARW